MKAVQFRALRPMLQTRELRVYDRFLFEISRLPMRCVKQGIRLDVSKPGFRRTHGDRAK